MDSGLPHRRGHAINSPTQREAWLGQRLTTRPERHSFIHRLCALVLYVTPLGSNLLKTEVT